jgi:hypothetical protein
MNFASAFAPAEQAFIWDTVSSIALRTSFSVGYSEPSKVGVFWCRFPSFFSLDRTSQACPVALETFKILPFLIPCSSRFYVGRRLPFHAR